MGRLWTKFNNLRFTPMKNNIRLDLDHHNKTRVEYFLNSVDEKLEQVPFDVQDLNRADNVIAAFKFIGKDRSISITVIFADSYFDANGIATENSFQKMPNTNWTVNGDILFVVESADDDVVSEMLSLFAGRE
jgi:hypothetical protein